MIDVEQRLMNKTMYKQPPYYPMDIFMIMNGSVHEYVMKIHDFIYTHTVCHKQKMV